MDWRNAHETRLTCQLMELANTINKRKRERSKYIDVIDHRIINEMSSLF